MPAATDPPRDKTAASSAYALLALNSTPASLTFDFEPFLVSDLNLNINPPTKSSASDGPCKYFMKGHCHKGASCPFRHSRSDKTIVCKHWLRGLCKKGDLCEFLHEYNLRKMPECFFYIRNGSCSNPECMYLHIDPESKVKDCPWYTAGFCKFGPDCRQKHVRRPICQNFVTGFCPKGPDCTFGHPKFDPPNPNSIDSVQQSGYGDSTGAANTNRPFRSLDQVTCFKCGEMGHYANHCTQRRQFTNAPGDVQQGQPIPSIS
ncbi:cleavage and polyadenylation specific factor 4, 30kDa [Geranomyces variabilis]|nr:cleavage and polyadenylation specific factor 4, 30kDa [Geranomyces variabilis]KAJ3141302.1 Cleavage and polyadenylation specificity factor subunit 4 [Geranomyces variabilis]